MDTEKFRVITAPETHIAAGRGLYTLTIWAVRQPGCTNKSVKECRRDQHTYCSNHQDSGAAIRLASYYGHLLATEPTFAPTILAKAPPKRRNQR